MSQLSYLERQYSCDTLDLLVAFKKTAERTYGENSIKGTKRRFMGFTRKQRKPLRTRFVKVGPTDSLKCFSGSLSVSGLTDYIEVGVVDPQSGKELPVLFARADGPEEEKRIEAFLNAVEEALRQESIYKGKAFVIDREYTFFDVSQDGFDSLVFNPVVLEELHVHVWGILKDPESFRKYIGSPVQRKILFAGPYGAGKTAAAKVTAKTAIENGWTFIYLPPTAVTSLEALQKLYRIARMYQPSVVFFEDIDAEQRLMAGDDFFTYRQNLGSVDGLISKNDDILTIMTTNRLKNIGGAMLRAGRIDKVIDFQKFEQADAVRLIQKNLSGEVRADNIDWESVGIACDQYSPAFVREVEVTGTLIALYQRKSKEEAPLVSHEILIKAAESLRERNDKCLAELGILNPNRLRVVKDT